MAKTVNFGIMGRPEPLGPPSGSRSRKSRQSSIAAYFAQYPGVDELFTRILEAR